MKLLFEQLDKEMDKCSNGVSATTTHRDVSLQEISKRLAEFDEIRGWDQHHSPRNLLLALIDFGRLGKWESCLRYSSGKEKWKRDYPNWSREDKEHLEEELSDVLLYLVRLADVCGLDLGQAALTKILKNAQKYPVQILTTHKASS